jgi:hypothetical protein
MNRVDELASLGEKLQQGIVLTQLRVEKLPGCRVKARAARTVQIAREAFQHISQMAQAARGMDGFMQRVFGHGLAVYIDTPGKQAAAGMGMELVIMRVRGIINELAAINAALDEEEKKNGEDRQAKAA